MIRDLTEDHLQAADPQEVRGILAEYSKHGERADTPGLALPLYMSILRQPAEVRGLLARFVASGRLFCAECGEPSCICGYPDDTALAVGGDQPASDRACMDWNRIVLDAWLVSRLICSTSEPG